MKRITSIGVVAVALVVSFAVARAGRSSDIPGVSALDVAAAPASIPPDVGKFIALSGKATGTDVETARADVRRLRVGLGQAAAELWAYKSARGSVCLLVRGQAALCPSEPVALDRGVAWITGGGYGAVPPNLAGIVADDVTAVTLVTGGDRRALPIVNSVVFGELARSTDSQLVIERRDRAPSTITVPAPDPR